MSQVIHSNLSAIVTELLRALGDRKWRDRQSACAGLSDVLRGRGWDEIGPHLEMLWTMADRCGKKCVCAVTGPCVLCLSSRSRHLCLIVKVFAVGLLVVGVVI